MSSISRNNVEYFVRDYLSLKSGNDKVDLSLLNELKESLEQVADELEGAGYSLGIDIKIPGYYTEEDKKLAEDENEEVQKDIQAYFEEML